MEYSPAGRNGLHRAKSMRLNSNSRADSQAIRSFVQTQPNSSNDSETMVSCRSSEPASDMSQASTVEEQRTPATPTTPGTASSQQGIWSMLSAWVGACPPAPESTTSMTSSKRSHPDSAHIKAYRPDNAAEPKYNPAGQSFEDRVRRMAGSPSDTSRMDSSGSDASTAEICTIAPGKRSTEMLQIMRSASGCSEDSTLSNCSDEELYSSWQPQYEAATRYLQTCLNTNIQGAALREAVADVYGAMHGVVALRQVALKQDKLEEVMAGVFFKPNQRLLLWMGGLRPTDLLACARIKMSALGETLSPEIATEVDKLQTACRNRQTALSRSFEELSEKLSRASAVAQFVVAHRRKEQPAGKGRRNIYGRQERTHNPMIAGIRNAMASMLIQADELRARLLEQLAVMLSPRQLALVLMAPLDMMASPF